MSEPATLHDDLLRLERVFDTALRVALPNPVALTFSDLRLGFQGKRDLVFALGLLEEGENEAALIAGLAGDALTRDARFDVAHLVREAWYYLRTSIDPEWQFDDVPPAFAPALDYIGTLVMARAATNVPGPDERRALLAELRAQPIAHAGSRIER